MESVQDTDTQNELAEVIFHAYFTDGLYPDASTLVSLGKKVGLDPEEVKRVVTDPAKLDEAHETAKDWSRKGVTGVPNFFINGQNAFSGAQDVQAFLKVFDIIAEKFPLEDSTTSQVKTPSAM